MKEKFYFGKIDFKGENAHKFIHKIERYNTIKILKLNSGAIIEQNNHTKQL